MNIGVHNVSWSNTFWLFCLKNVYNFLTLILKILVHFVPILYSQIKWMNFAQTNTVPQASKSSIYYSRVLYIQSANCKLFVNHNRYVRNCGSGMRSVNTVSAPHTALFRVKGWKVGRCSPNVALSTWESSECSLLRVCFKTYTQF